METDNLVGIIIVDRLLSDSMGEAMMATSVRAIYENGVFRPLKPLTLAEGAQVDVVIPSDAETNAFSAASILSQIAALPVEGDGDPFTSRDHDRVLYGDREQR